MNKEVKQTPKKYEHELKVKPLKTTFDDITQPEMVTKWRLPRLHFKLLACGPSGSGKSTAVINLLNLAYKHTFKKVLLIGPTSKVDKVWEGLKIDNFTARSKKEKISIDELKQMFKDGLRSVKRNGHTGPKTLIIFEDFINTVDPDTGKLLLNSNEIADLALVGRHAAISLVFLTQLYNKLPRRLRENCSHVIYLPSKNGENERLAEDYCPPRRNKKWMLELVMEATKPDEVDTHPFLYIDVFTEPEFKFRRNFDMLINWAYDEDTETMNKNFLEDPNDQIKSDDENFKALLEEDSQEEEEAKKVHSQQRQSKLKKRRSQASSSDRELSYDSESSEDEWLRARDSLHRRKKKLTSR